MSAFLVSQNHIDVMVYSLKFARHDETSAENLQHIGRALWSENHASCGYRYSHRKANPFGPRPTYHLRRASQEIRAMAADPVTVLKSCDCYEYQSSEHPGWAESPAYVHLRNIRAAATRRLKGYDDAPWGIA